MPFQLAENIVLLLALSTLYNFFYNIHTKDDRLFKVILGIASGLMTIISMYFTDNYTNTMLLDSSPVIISMASLFGGSFSASISVLTACVYKIYFSNESVIAGVITIIGAAAVGLAFRVKFRNKPEDITTLSLYLLGFTVQIISLSSYLFFLSLTKGMHLFSVVWLTAILIYPFVSILVGLQLRSVGRLHRIKIELKEKEEDLRITFNSIGDAVIVTDTNGNVVRLNPVAEQLTGYSVEEAVNKHIEEIFKIYNSSTNEKADNPVEKVISTGKVVGLANSAKLISKTGQEYQITDSVAPIFDETGKFKGVVLVIRDVTDEYSMKEALIKSEEKFRRVFENSIVPVVVSRLKDGKYVAVNRAFLRMMNFTEEEVIGKTSLELNTWANLDDRKTFVDSLIEKESVENFKAKFRTKNGDFKIVLISANTFLFNGEPHIISVMNDITDLKESERQLEIYRKILEKSLNEVYIIDAGALNFIHANDSALRNLGYSLEELREMTPIDIKPEFTKESFEKLITPLRKGDKNEIKFETVHKRKDGSIYNVEVHLQLISVEETSYFTAIILDITDKKKYEEDLVKAKEKAEEINRLKSIFFANMSHELRTPFVGIIGYSELLLDIITDPDARQMVEGILESSKRMKDTLTKILQLTQMEFEGYSIKIRPFDIRSMINEIIANYRREAQKKNIVISSNISVKNNLIMSDEHLLYEIISNILDNAIKYTNEGSVDIIINDFNRDNKVYLKILIKDSGIGIAKEKIDVIWDEFRQLSEGYGREYEGVGLGLSIVKKYVKLLNGEIFVESRLGEGSVFSVEVPIEYDKG
ncbi:signal transduction histidine kinase [Melioribacter roseus P3M-2]|uniref:histidine kinase n=1 Tax=Melioribacter roseus (strain DSM 23840 / JCM 17771 / VKM B-2668 / P3M-2) TaxID=1191523 RepID=I6ZRF0_MELRP|nr:PAS domain S-box protein [Melioribacter roseus]AFN74649.1 signal transduction histidine kinase [Melioribacter roseus P3M-2]